MSGCIAGYMFRDSNIIEQQAKSDVIQHKAVLRFRDDSVSRITGIQFKKVRVHKEIWLEGSEVEPTIQIANMYSLKVTGGIHERSIWNVEPVDRYIAPDNFHAIMLNELKDKIEYGRPFRKDVLFTESTKNRISTMPIFTLASIVGWDFSSVNFSYQNIHTFKMKLNNCDVYQTIYFPSHDYGIYRATITGDNLIVESIQDVISDYEVELIVQAFCLRDVNLCDGLFGEDQHTQKFGKISPIPDADRKKFIREMTVKYNLFSLGRFATWKNILLDDIVDDVNRIKELIEPWRKNNES